jgi:hypothetical protein
MSRGVGGGDDLSINLSLFSRGFLVLQDPMRNTHSSNFQRMSKCTVLCVLYQSQELSPTTECVSCVDQVAGGTVPRKIRRNATEPRL